MDRLDAESLRELEVRIGYRFVDRDQLFVALTHRSYTAEHSAEPYERLEFLGDAVLQLAVTRYLSTSPPPGPPRPARGLSTYIVSQR